MFADRPLVTAEAELLSALRTLDRRFTPIVVAMAAANIPGAIVTDQNGDAVRLFGASAGTFYLLRPDLHVAGRWRHLEAKQIIAALRAGLGDPK